jgi:hypothetical protein
MHYNAPLTKNQAGLFFLDAAVGNRSDRTSIDETGTFTQKKGRRAGRPF